MSARVNRLMADYENIQKEFAGNPYITVVPVGEMPVEKYHVTYNLDGINLVGKNTVVQNVHEVEITLTADYPRCKPVCNILTPIWHPNFKNGQICIGDVWGAGETLVDIIIHIGDMIQYKSWNTSNPISQEAAKWAFKNKQQFPIGNVNLNRPSNETVSSAEQGYFTITPEELQGIPVVSASQRMQQRSTGKGSFSPDRLKVGIDIKSILMKTFLWAVIGAVIGILFTSLFGTLAGPKAIALLTGHKHYAQYIKYSDKADAAYRKYDSPIFSSSEDELWMEYCEYSNKADAAYTKSYRKEFDYNRESMRIFRNQINCVNAGFWLAGIAMFIGLALGVGEGIFYGSIQKALIYGAIGAAIAFVFAFVGGYITQFVYLVLLPNVSLFILLCFIKALGWSIMGIGIGLSRGLVKPDIKRIAACAVGGAIAGFIGGFMYNIAVKFIPLEFIAQVFVVIVIGVLTGALIGLLEQFAKTAWIKTSEGNKKEFVLFNGTTSIGSDAKNMLAFSKNKSIEKHHCDIVQKKGQCVLTNHSDRGTTVNGIPVNKVRLVNGDIITIGDTVFEFHSR